ncbi:MAG: hypothetical protein R3282_08540, partial [Rhodothermales bacterium]|nr:hypothetical protein [Rhodothermales bacterium]
EIPSGWITFRLKNESSMTHFALLEKLPDGIGVADQQRDVAPVFQKGMDLLNGGEQAEAMTEFGKLPPWFGEIVFLGGPGFVAPGRTAEATVYIEPGTYLIECYVKTGGVFHSYNPDSTVFAMVHELTATSDSVLASEPVADLEVKISSKSGIQVTGTPASGSQVVAVSFEDQIVHENFIGHDIHVARLPDDVELDQLAAWMDWSSPQGLETPAPVTFLSGINEMPAGRTGYFSVTFEPGTYAWIAEVPNALDKGMLRTFEVVGAQ